MGGVGAVVYQFSDPLYVGEAVTEKLLSNGK